MLNHCRDSNQKSVCFVLKQNHLSIENKFVRTCTAINNSEIKI